MVQFLSPVVLPILSGFDPTSLVYSCSLTPYTADSRRFPLAAFITYLIVPTLASAIMNFIVPSCKTPAAGYRLLHESHDYGVILHSPVSASNTRAPLQPINPPAPAQPPPVASSAKAVASSKAPASAKENLSQAAPQHGRILTEADYPAPPPPKSRANFKCRVH
ncbi:hypothetical protein MKEN_00022700 [Mycena kentingensis (nom. inval.)]|nr:hypothetical protein MKEN_00022700 [Mycena kentingensis (nom. inval.)]